MKYYYVNVNAQTPPEDGEHEVHTEGCPTPPLQMNRLGLGNFSNCQEALRKARESYRKVDGCKNCIPACHRI